jgi:hypothetical protein
VFSGRVYIMSLKITSAISIAMNEINSLILLFWQTAILFNSTFVKLTIEIRIMAMEIADVIFSDIIYTLPENTNVSSNPIHDKVTLLDTTLCDKVCQ